MRAKARTDAWDAERVPRTEAEFDAFFAGVAEARFVLRHATRIVDQVAREHQLDPLAHQLLLQLLARPDRRATVSVVSERLDVSAAVGSRLALRLEERGLVTRTRSTQDRRVTHVAVTEAGRRACVAVTVDVRDRILAFGEGFTPERRRAALDAFAYYVGTAFAYDSSTEGLLG